MARIATAVPNSIDLCSAARREAQRCRAVSDGVTELTGKPPRSLNSYAHDYAEILEA